MQGAPTHANPCDHSIAVSVCYWFVAASIAELASAVPSSAGVYHWATITGGRRYGRICGFFAGYWNFFAYISGVATIANITGNIVVQIYGLYHPDFSPERWHVFVSGLIITWCCCCVVLFANRALPAINNAGGFFVIGGVLITIIVCAVMPGKSGGSGYATNDFVWKDWSADIGYSSNGFVFLMGMLNGAFAIGTPDSVSHLAEEIPRPEVNIPKGIFIQILSGTLSTVCFLIAIFYSSSDLSALSSESTPSFPLAVIYRQATGSAAGTIGLLVVMLLPTISGGIGAYIVAGRVLWTLARDGATPFSKTLGRVSTTWRNPFNATLACGLISTLLGCIYVGSSTAFNAFVGSFVILTTCSYLAALVPHVLSRRANVTPGPFWMRGLLGYFVHGISCSYMATFVVIYSFPYSLPVSALNMNYTCLISGGLTLFVVAWWFWVGKGYRGPPVLKIQGMKIDAVDRTEKAENV